MSAQTRRRGSRGSSVRGAGGQPTRGRPDRLEGVAARGAGEWDATLLWFMRLVALAWLVKGVLAWATILGAMPDAAPFETERFGRQAATAYFGVVDLMAAVGLWLASPWGGVIWLLAATSHLVLGIMLPATVTAPPPVLAAGAALIVAYLTLSSLAAREMR